MRRTFIRTLAPLAAITMVVGACSGDDDDGGSAEPTLPGSVAPGEGSDDSVATADSAATTEAPGGSSAPEGSEEVQTAESVLDAVKANDVLRCGVNENLAGFAAVNAEGETEGFDADFCRVIAAGVLGDATKVEFVPLNADARFPALQAGEIDVLVRNTTWTATRDGTNGANFLHPTFYDGQQMMVAADSGFTSIDDMDGTIVCVVAGTTTEGNVATEFASRGLSVDVQSFENVDLVQEAFINDQCDGWSSDGSQLASRRANFPDGPDALVIFEDVFSKEPLTPAVIDGDTAWAQAVEWTIFATIQAEEMGISKDSATGDSTGGDPAKVFFLTGTNADDATTLDPGLGLSPDFALQIVTQVGNYGEIFGANLTPIGIEERGLNALWTEGGLQYAPPYR